MAWSPDGKRLALLMTTLGRSVARTQASTFHVAHASAHTSVCGPELSGSSGFGLPRRRRLVAGRRLDRVHVRCIEDRAPPPDRVGETRDLDRARQRTFALVVARWPQTRLLRRANRPLIGLRDRCGRESPTSPGAWQGTGLVTELDSDRLSRRNIRWLVRRPAPRRRGHRTRRQSSFGELCRQFGPRQADAPEWSPDGAEIAVGTTSGVYVINADGTDLRRINSNSPYSGQLAWRPVHGKQIVMYGDRARTCVDC